MSQPDSPRRAKAVGINHVALEVGDIEEALTFYGRLLDFELRSKSETMAFVDLGDQFLALSKGRRQAPDDERHFGLVVDDREAVAAALERLGVERLPGPFMDFLDLWGPYLTSDAQHSESIPESDEHIKSIPLAIGSWRHRCTKYGLYHTTFQIAGYQLEYCDYCS